MSPKSTLAVVLLAVAVPGGLLLLAAHLVSRLWSPACKKDGREAVWRAA